MLTSQQPQAALLAEKLDINVYKHKYMSKKKTVQLKLSWERLMEKRWLESFVSVNTRIHLYFPAYNLAIECDEFGHNNRDVSYEVNR